MPSRLKLILPIVAVTLVSCTSDRIASPETARLGGWTNKIISDAVHSGGKPHFYLLPPMVSNPTVSGTFDAALAPSVVICAWTSGSCGSTIATYTMTSGPGGETVQLTTDEHYRANWHTNEFDLDPTATYRIRVLVGDIELGFADVDVVNSGKELKNVNTNEYIPLLDGRTLPIKFRVEQGFLARIEVVPAEATVGLGSTQQYVANLTDLHSMTLTDIPVAWSSDDEAVATVDQSGLATASADGATTIVASAAGVMGTASITVRGGVVTLGAGGDHSCALDVNGAAYCWGLNSTGQLGIGNFVLKTGPTPVIGGHLFRAIATGYAHTCGLKADGSAWCWGIGQFGSLGYATSLADQPVPVAVAGNHEFIALTAGYFHTCGLKANGAALCWGYNFYGQVGNGTAGNLATTPSPVTGSYAFQSLSAGGYHTCGITTSGSTLCWGYNGFGQLGNGTSTGAATPIPTNVGGAMTFASIGAENFHTCALDANGAAYCWGFNNQGAVGNDTQFGFVSTPTAVAGGLSFVELTGGGPGYHTCGRVSSGAAYCWGYNAFGQGGIGTTFPSALKTPTLVSGGNWATLSTGELHSCGITTAGVAKCWGYNGAGQLGIPGFVPTSTPTNVSGGIVFAVP
jgi:alpha-tubulin suppressor-like RCC1 family protein